MRNLKVKSKNIHLLFLPRDLLFFMFFVIYKNINVSKRCRKAFVFFAPIAVLCVLSDTENISQETQSFRKERNWVYGISFYPFWFIEPFGRRKKIGRLRWGSNRSKQNYYIKQTKKAAHKQLLDRYLKIIKQLSLAYSFPFLRKKLLQIVFAQASETQLFFSL